MARIRTVKPEFFTSHTVAQLTDAAKLTFIGLWTEADDAGVVTGDPRILKGRLWALDDAKTPADIDGHLHELIEMEHVREFCDDKGRRWLVIIGFTDHQRINRPSGKLNPKPPCVKDTETTTDAPLTEPSVSPHDTTDEPAMSPHCPEVEVEVEVEVEPLPPLTPPPPQHATAPAKPARKGDPAQPMAVAETLLNAWWETQHPRPQTSWIGAQKVLARALRAGHQPEDLSRFLEETQVISGAALDRWHRTRAGPPRLASPPRAAPTTEGALAHIRAFMGADQ